MTVLRFPAKGSTRDVLVYPDKPERESEQAYQKRVARWDGEGDKPEAETEDQFVARLKAWEPVKDMTCEIRQYPVEVAEEIARMYQSADERSSSAKATGEAFDEQAELRKIHDRVFDEGLVGVAVIYGDTDLRECDPGVLTDALREIRHDVGVAMAVTRNQRPTPSQGER